MKVEPEVCDCGRLNFLPDIFPHCTNCMIDRWDRQSPAR